jgi:beta-glucosidase
VKPPGGPRLSLGTAISAHQSEGNNIASDAWLCEQVEPTVYLLLCKRRQ